MSLKDIYEEWTFKPLRGVGAGDTPIKQSEGKVNVDFLPNTYQEEVVNREPGDKVVTQATEDNATVGMFNEGALGYYSTLVDSTLKTYKTKVVHKYNNTNTSYLTSMEVRNTPGALYINLND
jgi:hypothetical protein